MRTRVRKWGNSLAVRIPKPFAEESGLKASTEVEMFLESGALRVVAVRPRWTLPKLLRGVSKRNIRAEVDTGARAGKEAW